MEKIKTLQQAIEDNGGVDCEGEPETFFVDDYADVNINFKTRLAKSICAQCPVRLSCLQYALEFNEIFGIWGGLTPVERRRMKREGEWNESIYRSNSWYQ